ncbi:hydroxyethylthiazole kinase [Litoreibacter roseus]|uniref:Hydroxyethylthiazole kinase n=1 Tax=Litoreibacter roseus TaxID=2601869 RepID=A0A6N6JJ73_9RHOB|nr:hydroxyethylthiazole kinase [Litoreibacter roseus]GFE65997.1 hydroxyethylthiazole kinase [Litoreibacter roseus]
MGPADALSALRDQAPLVHNITNYVAMNVAANVLLAAGASPAMLHAEEEVAEFVGLAGALTINIGTLSAPWLAGMKAAARTATDAEIPWILDPVAHFTTPYRHQATQDLLALSPSIIRGNASEILALAGWATQGKGADAGDDVIQAEAAARELASDQKAVIAVSGAVDFITDGARSVRVSGGSNLMPKVTALGCSLTGLMGAFAAVTSPLEACVAASVLFGAAGEIAQPKADGPGTFAVHFIDGLASIQPDDLAQEDRLTWL